MIRTAKINQTVTPSGMATCPCRWPTRMRTRVLQQLRVPGHDVPGVADTEGAIDAEPLIKAGAAHLRPNKCKRHDWPFSKISNVFRVATAAPRLCRITMMLTSTSL
uniref:Uncharacterized protein n=1 Tax=Triticum urartu TaxID=4572 RepID=A0A8R7QHN2_TRIUA